MAVAPRSNTGVTYTSRTNTILTAPAGIQDGDILVILFLAGHTATAAPTATPPAGFAVVPGPTFPISVTDANTFQVKSWVWYKVASSESGNYTVTHTVATSQGWIGAYSGADAVTPISPNATSNSGSAQTTTALGLTTPRNGSEVIFLAHDWQDTNNNLSAPTGTTPTFTKEFGATVGNGSLGLIFTADGNLATAGATGNKTITNNNGTTNSPQFAAYLVSIQPPSATAVFSDSGGAFDASLAAPGDSGGAFDASLAARSGNERRRTIW